MNEPIWKDRVWLALVLGPLAWMAVLSPWANLDPVGLLVLYGVSLCLNLGLVSLLVPWLQKTKR